ncbi:MAG: sugar transferase [Chromatiaceae bacterium]|nr:sugar transferase [Chromatiaceae bacterium]
MRRWLRKSKSKSKSKINELPHFINVWLGHMSIAGPRPQTSRCFGAYSESSSPN